MGVDRRRGAIVLVIFGWVGLGVGELQNFELVGMWFDPITEGCFLLTSNIVFMKRKNPEHILTFKIVEWRKFIDYFGLSAEVKPSRVGEKNLYFVHIGSTPSSSSVRPHISRHYLYKEFNLEPPKLCLYQQTNVCCRYYASHISCLERPKRDF